MHGPFTFVILEQKTLNVMPQKLINQRFNIQDKEANYQHCGKLCQFMPILITITCVKIKKKKKAISM